jgi:uncharacterized membrane protein YphA (DoxX/SURF4 family)
MRSFRQILHRFCAIVIGLVFLMSGVLKLQDPVGTSLIVKEYFQFFGIPFLIPASKAVGILLSATETLCGAALAAGLWKKVTAVIASALIGVFTLVTVALVIFNPTMDCGCFGEAFHLTHMQSLLKNLVLCVLAAGAFLPVKDLEGKNRRGKLIAFVLSAGALLIIGIYSSTRLPYVDFTPFAPGAELVDEDDDEALNDLRDTLFIYEKNSQRGMFSQDRLPDKSWKLIGKTLNRIHHDKFTSEPVQLHIWDAAGEYDTDLLTDGDVVVVSAYSPEKLKVDDWSEVSDFFLTVQLSGMTPVLLLPDASVAPAELADWAYSADRKTLMTLNRSNGGVTWLHDADIIAKWAKRDIPSSEKWDKISRKAPLEYSMTRSSRDRIRLQGLCLYAVVLLLLL